LKEINTMRNLNTATTRAAVASVALVAAVALGAATPASAQTPNLLAQGAHSPAVADLQRQLNSELTQLPALDDDGKFGPLTAEAVAWFQGCAGIKADGVVGDQTRAALAANAGGRKVDAPCITVTQS